MAEFILPKDYLILLLNKAFRYGRKVLRIKEPFYGLELFSIDEKMRISKIVSGHEFREERDKVVHGLGRLDWEAPEWFDFKDCFLSSAALRPREWDGFVEQIHHIRARMTGPSRPRKPVYIGIDTNVAYSRIFSRHFPYVGHEEINPDCLELVVSELVRKEVDRRIGYRYKPDEVEALSSRARARGLVRRLGRTNKLSTRKAKLAQNEIDFLTKDLGALEVSGRDLAKDKERVDRDIAASYADFQESHSAEVILVTFDQNMVDHAKNARLSTAVMRFPVNEALGAIDNPWSLHSLIHDLAVTFGVVQLSPLDIHVWGEWQGKQTEDYELERVKIDIGESIPFLERFAKQAERCRKIIESMRED